jgi:hypothetical protein
MLPGPTIIKKCLVCSKSIKQHTIESGNTFGATFWTDGKREAPMLPDQPRLVMCSHCNAPLWIDELQELGEIEYSEDWPQKFKDAIAYKTPSIEDYVALLDKGVSSPEKEGYVRLRLWWADNDVRRTSATEIPISMREASNMKAFAEMLDETDADDLVMKAEIYRELGCSDDARALLEKSGGKNMRDVASFIKGLCEKGDRYVREIRLT